MGASTDHASIWADLRAASFSQGYIDAGGIRTRYLSSGSPDKPLLILLHGTSGHAECFSRNLAAHGEHFWTVAIDSIGHGWSDKPKIDYEIPAYADHVLAVMDALGRKTAHVSGESLGGWIAALLAVRNPDRVDRIVLNAPGGFTANPAFMSRVKELSTKAVEDPTHALIRARLEFLMYDKSVVNDDLVETRRAIYAQPGFKDVMARILCLQEMDIRRRNMITDEQARSIAAPTLVLWTTDDPASTPADGERVASLIPNSNFVVMSECGHWPQFERPEEFNKIHLDFLLGK